MQRPPVLSLHWKRKLITIFHLNCQPTEVYFDLVPFFPARLSHLRIRVYILETKKFHVLHFLFKIISFFFFERQYFLLMNLPFPIVLSMNFRLNCFVGRLFLCKCGCEIWSMKNNGWVIFGLLAPLCFYNTGHSHSCAWALTSQDPLQSKLCGIYPFTQ